MVIKSWQRFLTAKPFFFMILAWRLESAATFEDARHSQRHAVAPYEEAAYSSSP
jgi:hypothetical protein